MHTMTTLTLGITGRSYQIYPTIHFPTFGIFWTRTQATATADWTGAVMDGELTKVSMELTSSMTDLSLSDTDLLIAQLEADFAAYAEN